ncbi:hypothetical protein FY528_18205 [Hymenobacter lutimineralis]|uniref:Uncharacterized protein n=1 Tax=Hymenobacter lutimineralis TaxID=2606448 RepID=A0A5D6URW8_9BACT|nr:hypothetical protein [Hymenobacter lutimineralis]TYZ06441.1 hypothetical protein FY528_18205 [Hymenobacter lutimineralis]
MNTYIKVVIEISALIISVFIGYVIYMLMIFSAFGLFDKDYTRQDLITSYSEHHEAIQDAIGFYASVVPPEKEVEDDAISRIVVKEGSNKNPTYTYASDYKPAKIDSIVSSLGWTQTMLDKLQEKLEAADCISIQNGEPAKLGFKRSGMGMYSFNVFKKPIPDSLREQYARSCTYLIQSDELVLEYGGGAMGPQCFPPNY